MRTVVAQLDEWLAGPYFTGFVAAGPEALLPELAAAAARRRRGGGRDPRLPARRLRARSTEGTPDAVGRERYALAVRRWTGSDLGAGPAGLEEAYAWGWAEHRRILAEQRIEADKVLPGATPMEAMRWLGTNGPAVEGVEAIRERLQAMMDDAIAELDGTHFDLAEPVRTGRGDDRAARQRGGAVLHAARRRTSPGRAAPGCRRSAAPASRSGTWSRSGTTRAFPATTCSWRSGRTSPPQLSTYQTSLGSVGANVEGWALYAERLMDELGYFADPADAAGLPRRAAAAVGAGGHRHRHAPRAADPGRRRGRAGRPPRASRGRPDLARAFLGENSGADVAFLDSELVRYLGIPGQAISYKLGERAWLEGRAAAQQARGDAFDLKAWHMAALSQGSLGLDDLAAELARL